MSQKLSAFWQIFLWRSFENYILRVHKNSLRTFLRKKTNFPSFLDFDWKNLCLFPEKFRRGCQNCIPPVHRNISRSFFLGKSTISSLSDVVGELFDLFRKSMGGVVKLCNYVSIETFRRKKVFFPAKRSFSKEAGVEGKFFGNCRKNFVRAAKTGFHTNISQKNTDSEKSLFLLNFGHRAEQFLPFVDVF